MRTFAAFGFAVQVLGASVLAFIAGPIGLVLAWMAVFWQVTMWSAILPPFFVGNTLAMFVGGLVVTYKSDLAAIALFCFAVLPLILTILPRNYWLQQFGIVIIGTGCATGMTAQLAKHDGDLWMGAFGGFVAAGVFARCVHDLFETPRPAPDGN